MAKDRKRTGICPTCRNTSNCTYSKEAGPVLLCEDFEPLESKGPPRRKSRPVPIRPPAGKGKSATFKGLCANCENRGACRFPKPEWGIWHCGEYR